MFRKNVRECNKTLLNIGLSERGNPKSGLHFTLVPLDLDVKRFTFYQINDTIAEKLNIYIRGLAG